MVGRMERFGAAESASESVVAERKSIIIGELVDFIGGEFL